MKLCRLYVVTLAIILSLLLATAVHAANQAPTALTVAPQQDGVSADNHTIFKVGMSDPENMAIKSFQLQVASDPQFATVLIDSTRNWNYLNPKSYTIPATEKWYVTDVSLPDNLGGAPYYWRAKVQDTDPSGAAGLWSAWSVPTPFYVDNATPEMTIINPPNDSVIDPRGYRFTWTYSDPKGSPQASVLIKISDAVNPAVSYGTRTIQTGNQHWINDIDIPGSCAKAWVTIMVTNETGYSSVQGLPGFRNRFVPAPPKATPVSPPNGENINDPVSHFTWTFDSVSGASQTEFKFQLATDAGFTNLLSDVDILSVDNFYDLPSAITIPGLYYWRVAGNDGKLPWTPNWSATQRFSVSESVAQAGLGLKSFYEYSPVNLGFPNLDANVNLFNGNLYLSATDFGIPARGLSLGFGRSYNSQSSIATAFGGDKWVGGISRLILETSGNVTVLNADGSYTVYLLNPDGTFMPPPGEGRRLVLNADNTFSVLTKERVTYRYDDSGYLLSITDRYGNSTNYGYQDYQSGSETWHLPTTISDSSDSPRALTIEYEPGTVMAFRIKSVTDPAARKVQFSYDTLDRVTSVTDPGAHVLQYSYDDESRLTGITDEDGNAVTFEYDANSRVIGVTSAAENAIPDPALRHKTAFAYDTTNLKTTRTDENNRLVEYVFYGDGSPKSVSKMNPISVYIDRVTEYQWDQREVQLVTKKGRGPWEGTQTTTYSYSTNTDGMSDLTKTVTDFGNGKLNLTESYAYDQYHNKTSVTDPNGNVTTYDWGTDGNDLLRVIRPAVPNPLKPGDPSEQPITVYTYDNHGQKLTQADPDGNETVFTYDGFGNLKTVTTPHSVDSATGQLIRAVTTYDYDLVGRKRSEISPRNQETRFEYGPEDLVTDIYYPDGGHRSYTYGPFHQKLTEIAKVDATHSYTTSYSYDPDGRLKTVDYPDGGQVSYAYDSVGNKVQEDTKIDQTTARTTTYIYDHDDLLESEYVSGHFWTRYTHDQFGNKTKESKYTDATLSRSAETVFEFDGANRLVRVIDPENSATTYTYDSNGNRVSEKNALLVDTVFQYDALNRLTAEIRAAKTVDESTRRFTYQLNGLKQSETDPNNNTTTFEYYPNGLLQRQNNPDGGWVAYEYDLTGNKTLERVALDSTRVSVTRSEYGPTNLLTQVNDAKNGVTKYEYDLRGKLTALVNAKNNRTSYEYDSMGRLTSATDAGLKSATYTYDLAGNRTQMIDRKGQTITYGYDVMGRLTLARAPGLLDTTYTYDWLGNKLTMTDATGTTTYTYDLDSRLKTVTDPQTRVTEYEYDEIGNRTFMTDPYDGVTKKTSYLYDNLGRLKSVTDPDGKTATYTYDKVGRKIGEGLPGGAQVTYEYDPMGRIKHLVNLNAQGQVISEYTYTYDLAGNQLSKGDSRGTTAYEYDELSRLTKVTNPDLSTVAYGYDETHNRKSVTDGSGQTLYEYNNLDQLQSTAGPSGTTTYEYDFNGNQTRVTTGSNIRTFTYDAFNRQIATSGPEGDGSYTYDGEDHRVSKTENGVTKQYVFDGDMVLLELDGSGAYTKRYLYGRGSLSYLGRTTLTGTPEYLSLLLNGHKDVEALLAADGMTTANSYYYDAFGGFLTRTETASNDLYYAQQEYDDLTGNYHMGVREYAPGLGRFTTADSWTELPDDERGYRTGYDVRLFDLYGYCANNPVAFVDPSGHRWDVSGDGRYTASDRTPERVVDSGRGTRDREMDRYIERERDERNTRNTRVGGAAAVLSIVSVVDVYAYLNAPPKMKVQIMAVSNLAGAIILAQEKARERWGHAIQRIFGGRRERD